MRTLLIITLVILANFTFAQNTMEKKSFERKGFIFGLGMGVGSLSLNTNDTLSNSITATLPNIKIGYMLSNRFALLALLPGANYKYKEKDRGYEGFLLSGQYWVKNNWWVLGGAGLTFDAPAFYTVDDPKTAEFYAGLPALTFSTGYEVWHKGKFALDLQYRLFYGKSSIANNGFREGVSNMLIVGFNWY